MTSEPMSWFSFSLVGTVLTSIGITIAVIFNMRLYYNDESTEVMSCLYKQKSSEKNTLHWNRYINTHDNQHFQQCDSENSKISSALFGDNHDQSTNHFSNVHKIFSSYLNRGGTLQTSFHETSSVSNDDNLETYNAHTIWGQGHVERSSQLYW